ncbi:MAG: DUF402 domain-containing protein, partial [Dehalococcoidia bacterium]
DGRPGMSWPAIVVQDDALLALYIPAGTLHKRWSGTGVDRKLVDVAWRVDTLRLMYPGAHHSIWATWERHGEDRAFRGYYVNMEEPFRRTAIGFDTNDHMLDILVAPDLSWKWKDEDVVADFLARGVYSAEFAAAIRAEGERVAAAIEGRGSPFCDAWDCWAPPPSVQPPALPEGWDTVPATLWERRRWAYGEIAPPLIP